MARRHPISGLSKWVDRGDWFEHFKQVVVEHVEAACADAGVAFETLDEVIGDELYASLWSAAFEDFLTRDLDDGRNIVDDYLKRRGWKESPGSRAYLQALRHASMSLYLVEDVAPGEAVTLRDELRDRPSLDVRERELTKPLQVGRRIACRVFQVRGQWRMGSLYLELDEVAMEELEDRLAELNRAAQATAPELLEDLGEAEDEALAAVLADFDTLLAGAGFLFTDIWLRQILETADVSDLPPLVAPTGEPYEVARASWPLEPEADPVAVREILEGLPQLRATDAEDDSEGEPSWRYVDADAGPPVQQTDRGPDDPVILDPRDDEGAAILGSVALVGRELRLSGNTMSRLERGQALLEAALGDRLGPPHLERRSLDEAMREARSIEGQKR